jgi:hypothetical protein
MDTMETIFDHLKSPRPSEEQDSVSLVQRWQDSLPALRPEDEYPSLIDDDSLPVSEEQHPGFSDDSIDSAYQKLCEASAAPEFETISGGLLWQVVNIKMRKDETSVLTSSEDATFELHGSDTTLSTCSPIDRKVEFIVEETVSAPNLLRRARTRTLTLDRLMLQDLIMTAAQLCRARRGGERRSIGAATLADSTPSNAEPCGGGPERGNVKSHGWGNRMKAALQHALATTTRKDSHPLVDHICH